MIRKLGMDRLLSGEQIYDSTTGKLRPRYRDLTRTQLRGLLLWAQHYAQKHNQELRLYYREKRFLAKIFNNTPVVAVAFGILAMTSGVLAILLTDFDGDGIPDILQHFESVISFLV